MPPFIVIAIVVVCLALIAFATPKLIRYSVSAEGWNDAKHFVDAGAARAYLYIWFKPNYKNPVLRECYEKAFAESLKVNTEAREEAEKRQRQSDLERSRAAKSFLSKHGV